MRLLKATGTLALLFLLIVASIVRVTINDFAPLLPSTVTDPFELLSKIMATNESEQEVSIDFSMCTRPDSRAYNISTCICYKTLYGNIDLSYVKTWINYYRNLGIDEVFMWYWNLTVDSLAVLSDVPGVTLSQMPDAFIGNNKNPRRPFEAGQAEAEKRCMKMARDRNITWALFIDADEFLWFQNQTGLKDFLLEHDDKAYLSFGKWMYSLQYIEKSSKNLGFGLNTHPFTPRSYCYKKRGDKYCPTWVGRSKVMVRPQHYTHVGVHGDPRGKQRSIHFNTDQAHLKEWRGIANPNSSQTYVSHNRSDFRVDELDTHVFRDSHPLNEDGSITVYYDRELESWLKYVKSREACRIDTKARVRSNANASNDAVQVANKSNPVADVSQRESVVDKYDEFLTIIVATMQMERFQSLMKILAVATNHPLVENVIILWNGPDMPEAVSRLSHVPAGGTRVTVLQKKINSLNNRYDPDLPIRTGAVMILDDDIVIYRETIDCVMSAWKRDPWRLYSFGEGRHVASDGYGTNFPPGKPGRNFLLPRFVFHRIYLSVYFDKQYQHIREYVDTQGAHCDDIAFASIVTKFTNKPMTYVPARNRNMALKGMTHAPDRERLRNDCAKEIVMMLNWTMPDAASAVC